MPMDFAYDRGYDRQGVEGGVRKVIASWTSASDGTASGTTAKIVGQLVKITTNPGSVAPSDNYDIAITDEDGVDVLAKCDASVANRDTTTSEEVYCLVNSNAGSPLAVGVHPVVCGPVTVAVTNAGDAKNGVITLYLR